MGTYDGDVEGSKDVSLDGSADGIALVTVEGSADIKAPGKVHGQRPHVVVHTSLAR